MPSSQKHRNKQHVWILQTHVIKELNHEESAYQNWAIAIAIHPVISCHCFKMKILKSKSQKYLQLTFNVTLVSKLWPSGMARLWTTHLYLASSSSFRGVIVKVEVVLISFEPPLLKVACKGPPILPSLYQLFLCKKGKRKTVLYIEIYTTAGCVNLRNRWVWRSTNTTALQINLFIFCSSCNISRWYERRLWWCQYC